MEIKVYGPGCAKCKTTLAIVEKFVAKNGIAATIIKVDDIMEMMNNNILATPAIAINGVVRIKGRVPSEFELAELFQR